MIMWIGLVLLLVRGLSIRRARANSSAADVYVLALVVASLGLYITLIYNVVYGLPAFTHDISRVGAWLRGLLSFSPDPTLMADIPLILKIHIALVFLLLASIPLTRLIHFFAIFPETLLYPIRRPIVYRSI